MEKNNNEQSKYKRDDIMEVHTFSGITILQLNLTGRFLQQLPQFSASQQKIDKNQFELSMMDSQLDGKVPGLDLGVRGSVKPYFSTVSFN